MNFPASRWLRLWAGLLLCGLAAAAGVRPAWSQEREFRPGAWTRLDELPAGRLRARLEGLGPVARQRALDKLRNVHFPEQDALRSLHVNEAGDIYYADSFGADGPVDAPVSEPASALAATMAAPVTAAALSSDLIFHSRLGSSHVFHLDFDGASVSNTPWNSDLGRATLTPLPYDTDGNPGSFSTLERRDIKRIWQRVAEHFAPFDVDVTTEAPANLTGMDVTAVITGSRDGDGQMNPGQGSVGGIAYVDSWGRQRNYVWCYPDNLGSSDHAIGGCLSHEIGHTLALSHDGQVASGGSAAVQYYSGHGSGETSWGPIMGSPYSRNVTQWSDGNYYRANNTQNDRSLIAQRLGYRGDDHGNTQAGATPLVISAGGIISTTPENDPYNTSPVNKGVIQGDGDAADVFSFPWSGAINLSVSPWIVPGATTRGGNLDVRTELRDVNGVLVGSSDPPAQTAATIQATLPAGTYYLHVRNAATGNPVGTTPTGYTLYGSNGQFFVNAAGGDTDGDGAPNASDNCFAVANNSGAGPQCDSDGDGYGNACDADFNNSGATNAQDTVLFRQQLGKPSVAPAYNEADLNCNGAVNAQDTTLFRQRLGSPPGPSGLAP